MGSRTENNTANAAAAAVGSVCDLCGTATAIVKCGACSEQIFCLACDDMYHRHPKRSTHVRKAIGDSPIKPPALPPKGEPISNGPIAPPRKNIRKGSAPDSPVNSRPTPMLTRSSTLPRKMNSSMVGRPLPPPPPANDVHKPVEVNPPPPALPVKNAQPQPPPPHIPSSSSSAAVAAAASSQFYPNGSLNRKMSAGSQPPMHLNYPPKPMMPPGMSQPEIPMPAAYPPGSMPTPAMIMMMQQQQQQQQQQQKFNGNNIQPGSEMGYPLGGPNGMNPMTSPDMPPSWKNNPYIEEMQFPTAQSLANFGGHGGMEDSSLSRGQRSSRLAPSQRRSQFFKLNKSTSLHDLAHDAAAENNQMRMRPPGNGPADMANNGGISWMDEPWNTTQSTMNQPTMNVQELLAQQRNFRRSTSTKSLHQTSEDLWNSNPMWDPQRMGPNAMMNHPMMNPMMFAASGMGGQMPNSLHRSMHELRLGNGGVGGGPDGRSTRGPSPTNSTKSKKSTRSDRFANRANRHRRNPSNSDSRPASRPQSRNTTTTASRNASNNAKNNSTRHYRGSSRGRRRSMSTEDEMDSDAAVVNDFDNGLDEDEDDEDFFTGESDNDFMSLSSGSNSRRAPRKSWICEHCTYLNNPGVSVCAMCSRTSKFSRGEDLEASRAASRTSNRGSKKKKKNALHRYESSEDEESERQPNAKRASSRNSGTDSKTNSLKRRSNKNRKKLNKSPMPEYNVSDLEQDNINEYYAVRHKSDGRYQNESSSETSSIHNNPLRKPNFDAPAPAKGILKKSNSNPHLTKLEQEVKASNSKQSVGPPGRVVDIKKYLAQTQNNPHLSQNKAFSNDIWQQEKHQWMRANGASPTRSFNPAEDDDLSDVASNSSTANNVGRPLMKRSVSGHSLGDLEYFQQQEAEMQQSQRKSSVAEAKRNFRSKRFSRNMEREPRDPALRRAQSLHMDRRSMENDRFVETQRGIIRRSSYSQKGQPSSGSSGPDDGTLHFTATVSGHSASHDGDSNGAIGSYLARQEFGSTEGQPIGDSGYISHSSGSYPKMPLPVNTYI